MAGPVAHGKDEKCMQNLVRKPEGKTQLRRPRHSWDDNITMDLKETDSIDCIHLAQNRDQ
jgi:hypothetical protein